MMIVYNKTFTRRLYMGPIFGPYFTPFSPIFGPFMSNYWTLFSKYSPIIVPYFWGVRVFNTISTEFSTNHFRRKST